MISEGYKKKGGKNGPPTGPRPEPPKGQGKSNRDKSMNEVNLEYKKIKLESDDILVVKIPKDEIPVNKWVEHAEKLKEDLKREFPNNKVLITFDNVEISTQKEER